MYDQHAGVRAGLDAAEEVSLLEDFGVHRVACRKISTGENTSLPSRWKTRGFYR